MLFLQKVVMKSTFRNIPPCEITFREGLNIIVGENGAGKSSLLKMITSYDTYKAYGDIHTEPGCNYHFLDTEKHNPRTKNDCNSMGVSVGYHLMTRFASHGEVMLPVVLGIRNFKDTLLIIDEPEAGVSLSNQSKIVEALRAAVAAGCQVLVVTHSYIIITSVSQVLSMDTQQWMPSQEYLTRTIVPVRIQ